MLQVFKKCLEMTQRITSRVYALRQLVTLVKESERDMRKGRNLEEATDKF